MEEKKDAPEGAVVNEAPKEEKKKEKNKNKNKNVAPVVLSLIAVALGGTSLGFSIVNYQRLISNSSITILSSPDGNSTNFVEGSIADIANKVSSSVVSIVTSTTSMSFFGRSYSSAAAGTGIIATSDGYIVTNKHVIDGATTITVILDNGTTYEDVKLAAYDPLNDVAYLKIDNVSDLPAATLGNSKSISVGQQVIAIGNALGEYQNTVTSGIISGTGRSLTATDSTGTSSEELTDMIQTDAAINSGNSGGPLVNAAGEVIGINTATTNSADGIGFAIPISSVKGMLNQLIETGSAERAYIGVYSANITPELAKEYNLPVNKGVYIYSNTSYSAVMKDSPAAKAGIQDKDIITAVNGVEIGAAGSLSSLLGEYKPNDTIQLTVLRGNDQIQINVTLGAYKK